MARSIRPTAVLPPGLALQQVEVEGDLTVIMVRSVSGETCCPGCGEPTRRVHSRYIRTLLDLPMGGRSSVCNRRLVRPVPGAAPESSSLVSGRRTA
jgi:zinc-finger of transposase IS204/IS1001/IS1096/IS1165